MVNLETKPNAESSDLTRRDFLRVGSLAVGVGLSELAALPADCSPQAPGAKACIQLFLVGGPSQLETWDLKPNAPDSIRGPFRPIHTNIPGIGIGEHFPLMARRADRYAILRSVHHQESPIHETGQQLLQTGHLVAGGVEWPHAGAVLSNQRPLTRNDEQLLPPWVLLPGPMQNTGVSVSHGQGAGFLYETCGPVVFSANADPHPVFNLGAESDRVRTRYGRNPFGQNCLLARRLVQRGVRFVTVNMFDTVFGQVTWDCHANGGDLNTTLNDYKDTLCPMLDQAYTALLDDLEALGLLQQTLVVCTGEFGRTPRISSHNGRDHWPGVWNMLMAGGGVRGGQVIGSSDAHASEPKDRPIHAAEVAATMYHVLGIDCRQRLRGPDGQLLPLVEAEPVWELF